MDHKWSKSRISDFTELISKSENGTKSKKLPNPKPVDHFIRKRSTGKHFQHGLQTESSVGDDIQIENLPQNFQPHGFYTGSAEDIGNEAPIFNHGDQLQVASTFHCSW